MSLNININPTSNQKTFEKPVFLQTKTGQNERIRLLQEDIVDVYKHFIPGRNVSIVCPGSDCPICLRNRRLSKENPGVPFNQVKGVIPRQHRFMVNVLNRTPVKRDSSGNIIRRGPDGQFPPVSPNTGEIIVKVAETPLDEIQILEKGTTLFNQFLEIDARITDGEPVYLTDSEGNLVVKDGVPVVEKTPTPLGILNYDVILRPTGVRQQMEISVEARPDLNDKVEVDPAKLYKLDEIGLRLDPSEIEKLIAGVSLKDIFEARRATSMVNTGETSKEAEGRVNSLFDADDSDFDL